MSIHCGSEILLAIRSLDERPEHRGRFAVHPALIAACQAMSAPVGAPGLLARLLCGAALLVGAGSDVAHADPAACTFPATIASGGACVDLVVPMLTSGDIVNNGAISSSANGSGNAIDNSQGGAINTLTNSAGGTITGDNAGIYNAYDSAVINGYSYNIQSIINNGTISGAGYGIQNWKSSINTLTNNGVISGVNAGINNLNYGSINVLTNAGSISSQNYGIWNRGTFNIATLTNTGVISGSSFGVLNEPSAVIAMLANAQGGDGSSPAQTALTYSGALPYKYNIIVTSPTSYGQMFVTGAQPSTRGPMIFGVDRTSTLIATTYANVLTGVPSNYMNSIKSGSLNGYGWQLVLETGATSTWDLVVSWVGYPPGGTPSGAPGSTPSGAPGTSTDPTTQSTFLGLSSNSAIDTLSAVNLNAVAVRNVLNARTALISGAMNYDCATFDAYGVCLSFQARYSGMEDMNNGAGVLTASYLLAPNLRLGGFIDLIAAQQNPVGLKFVDQSPMIGAFVAYGDQLGPQAKMSVAMNKSTLSVLRSSIFDDAETASGAASLNSYVIAGEFGWGVDLDEARVATPYAGLRYTDASRGAYSEYQVAGTDDPLTYAAYAQQLTTATAGLRLRGMMSDQVGYQLGLGVEYDLVRQMGAYAGTSAIPGLESFSLSDTGASNRFRLVGTAGLFYQVDKTSRLIANASLRGQAYSNQPTLGLLAGYQTAF